MYSNQIKNKAMIISIKDNNNEIKQLINSLDYKVFKIFIQNKKIPDVNSYIGRGKVEEIYNFIRKSNESIDLIVVDGKLKPSQWFNLEKKFNIKVYDRIRLILEIFKQRADNKEAKLQVKYAELQYEKPFVKELIHRARNGEHPGFMAGGEYQVDDYFEMIKKQMKIIKNNLNKIEIDRKIQRKNRHLSGFYLISLAGYTNAGKSSILNILSDEKIRVEEKLFSTLSTTSRKIKNINIPVLITDTVGFIENLPTWLINAFHSTLEEIELADLVLLIADVSDNFELFYNKINTSFNELNDLGVESPILIILNKIDLISASNLKFKIDFLKKVDLANDRNIIPISVKNRININKLIHEIYRSLPGIVKFNIKLKNNKKSQSLINWIYSKAYVSKISYDNNISLTIESNELIRDIIISKVKKFNN